MGFKVSQIGTAGSMAVLVLVLESMAAASSSSMSAGLLNTSAKALLTC